MGARAQPRTSTWGCSWVSLMGDGAASTLTGAGRLTAPQVGKWASRCYSGSRSSQARSPLLFSHSVSPQLVFLLSVERCARDDRSDSSRFGLWPADTVPGPCALLRGCRYPPSLDCEATTAPCHGLPASLPPQDILPD